MSLGQVIKRRRTELKLTLQDVSDKVGCSKPYLSTIETDKSKNPPSDDILKKLEKALSFEDGFLLRKAHMQQLPIDIRYEYETAEAENQRWRSFIRDLINSKDDINQINNLLGQGEFHIAQNEDSMSAGKLVPVINKVEAGYPAEFTDLDYPVGIADDYVRCPDLNDPHAFAVRVVGDSMEPRFYEGDIIIFSPQMEVRNGDDCFIRFKMPHETSFKRVFFEPDGKIRLQPRNEKYPPIITERRRIDGLYRAIRRLENL